MILSLRPDIKVSLSAYFLSFRNLISHDIYIYKVYNEEIKIHVNLKFFFFKFSRYRLKYLQLSPRFHFSLCTIFEQGICFHYFYSHLKTSLLSTHKRYI